MLENALIFVIKYAARYDCKIGMNSGKNILGVWYINLSQNYVVLSILF